MAAAAPTAADFLRTLWGDVKGWAELTAIQGGVVKSFPFTYPDSLDSLIFAAGKHNKTDNVYMGVCLRKDKWPRWTGRMKAGKKEMEFRGTEENALSSFAVWCEFDFEGLGHKGRTVPEATARKWLLEFKLKPSIIVRSGGGVQVFWLLKEAAQGDDLWKVKATNKAIVEHFTVKDEDGKKHGADTQSVDLARIFRIPGSMNMKYTPSRPCEISWWKPEFRYNLPDFEEFLQVVDSEKPKAQLLQLPQTTSPETPAATPPSGQAPSGDQQGPRPVPALTISDEKVSDMIRHFSEIWFEGNRHAMALRVAGMLAFAGVSVDVALRVVGGASNSVGGDTEKRLKDVTDTYDNFVAGKEVAGGPALEKMISEDFPALARDRAKKVLLSIRKLFPKPPAPPGGAGPGGGDPGFRITKVVKFTSDIPRYMVTIEKEGQEYSVSTEQLFQFREFEEAAYGRCGITLPTLKQPQWKYLLSQVTQEIREAPKEASTEGAIQSALEEFLQEAKENPEPGLLKRFAGYDDVSEFMRFEAFIDFSKNAGNRFQNREVFDYLHKIGFSNAAKRLGPRGVQRLWVRTIENGNGRSNGHPQPGEPLSAEASKKIDLEPSIFPESTPSKGDVQEPYNPEEDWGIT
jgi:hypothetical protein